MHGAELTAFCTTTQEHVMSFVRIEQRNARLAQAVKLDQIKGREGFITKGTVVVLSNVRKGEGREDEVTSILWTLWGGFSATEAPGFLPPSARGGGGGEGGAPRILWTLWGKQADNAAEYLGK